MPHRVPLAGRLTLVVALALGVVPSRAGAQTPAPLPPTIVAPFPFTIPRVSAPFLFQWTTASPGRVYDVHVEGRSSLAAASLVGVSYELQISDRVDVASHPLFDAITDQTSYLFSNEIGLGGFTTDVPPDTALVGGRYFWRVRSIFAGAASAYSRVGSFRLERGGGGPPLHALGIVALRVAGPARAASTTLVVASVQNLGTFAEDAAQLTIFADGVPLGTSRVAPLTSDGVQVVSVPWTPARSGLANLYAQLEYVDDDQRAHGLSLTAFVLGERSVRTRMVGTIDVRLGDVTLRRDDGATIATLVNDRAAAVDLASYAGKRVRLDGRLSTSGGAFVLTVRSVGIAPAGT